MLHEDFKKRSQATPIRHLAECLFQICTLRREFKDTKIQTTSPSFNTNISKSQNPFKHSNPRRLPSKMPIIFACGNDKNLKQINNQQQRTHMRAKESLKPALFEKINDFTHFYHFSIQLAVEFSLIPINAGERFVDQQSLMSHPEPRVRKSLSALAGTDERKGYFYCLKLLGVLPVPPKSDLTQFTYYTPPTMKGVYRPKCLHDVLIASHATSCEHTSFYFSFYHRHLMILTELFLNFAHQVLRGGEQKIKQIYPSPEFDFLHNAANKKLWDEVFAAYNGLKDVPNTVSAHYWNPTDYLSDSDLSIPAELAIKQAPTDPIDLLFYSVNKSYPWEFHVPRRWYNNEADYKRSDLDDFFQPNPVKYTDNETKFINGELDPRKNEALFMEDKTLSNGSVVKKFIYDFNSQNSNAVLHRNFLHFSEEKKNYLLNSTTADESLVSYGARSKNAQYITAQERKQFGLSSDFLESYNNILPHYQYANALFNQNMQQFIETSYGGERSHNYMHNNFRYILSDAAYSVTSLLFWTYHGWIDAQIEIKLRRGNQEGNRADYDYIVTALNDKYGNAFPARMKDALKKVFTQVSEKMEPMSNWRLSGDTAIDPETAGIYPIAEWVTPSVKQVGLAPANFTISAAFCARDLALTHTDIRDSFHLNDIYQNYYAELYADRFYFFDGVKGFNYNYDYQVGSNPADLAKRLGRFAQNLPEYLANMSQIWLPQKMARQMAVRQASNIAVNIHKQLAGRDVRQFENVESECIRKLFETGIELFAAYSPFSKNGPNPVYLKLNEYNNQWMKGGRAQEYGQALKHYTNKGIEVHDVFIFGKENFADACHKCAENKAVFEDLDEHLRTRAPFVWSNLHLDSLSKVYYDSERPGVQPKSILNSLTLVPNPKFADYRLLSGAEELVIYVNSNIRSPEQKFIRLDAISYSAAKDSVHAVLSKKTFIFGEKFDFYKIFDVDTENDRIFFDRYVYKTLRGWVSVGTRRTKFEVAIPNYQRLLRLSLYISQLHGGLKLQLVDFDFEVKKTFYENAGREE